MRRPRWSAKTRIELDRDASRSTREPEVEGRERSGKHPGEREVLGVVGLGPAELVRDPPGLGALSPVTALAHDTGFDDRERAFGGLGGDEMTGHGDVQGGSGLGPQKRRCDELVVVEQPESVAARGGGERDVRVDDDHGQSASRMSRTMSTQSGIGSFAAVCVQKAGSGTEPAPVTAARSASSITCCVPTLRAARRPARIHRLIVSGLRPVRRAASGTVSTVVEYYNMSRSGERRFVGRRFYRRRYDAQRTLAGFSARPREQVELEAFQLELSDVVRETMQPAHVSLWHRTQEIPS